MIHEMLDLSYYILIQRLIGRQNTRNFHMFHLPTAGDMDLELVDPVGEGVGLIP